MACTLLVNSLSKQVAGGHLYFCIYQQHYYLDTLNFNSECSNRNEIRPLENY